MNASLYDLKNRLLELKDKSWHDDKFFEQLSSLIEDYNTVLKDGEFFLRDYQMLKEFSSDLYAIFERLELDDDEPDSKITDLQYSIEGEILFPEARFPDWRDSAKDNYDECYQELLRDSHKFKPSRRDDGINEDIWAKMLENEENSLESSIEKDEYDAIYKDALLRMSRANELCLNTTYERDNAFLFYLTNYNYIDAFHQALRLNILLSETFPDTLKPEFLAWLKGEEASEPGQAQGRRKVGKQKEDLFTQEKTDEMKKRFLEYLRDNNLEPENVKIDSRQKVAINKVIVRWLKDLEQEKLLVENGYSKKAVFRFLTEICGLERGVEEKSYANKLCEWLSNYSNGNKAPISTKKNI